MSLINPLANAFALDIGDRTFKIMQIMKRRGPKPYRITAWGEIDVPEGVLQGGEIIDLPAAVERIHALMKAMRGKLVGRAVVACLPEAKTFIKVIELPVTASAGEIRKAVLAEIEQDIPLPPGEIYHDWQVVEEAHEEKSAKRVAAAAVADQTALDQAAAGGFPAPIAPIPEPTSPPILKRRVLIGAAPKNLVDSYTQLLERAGLAPIALEIEALAAVRTIAGTEPADEAYGILDIGASRSNLVIVDDGIPQMSISIPISGLELTSTISHNLGVSLDDAELLKRECGLDATRCDDKIWKVLLPLIDDMTEKIRNALRFYKVGFAEAKKIEKLLLCGGGGQFRDIDTVLSRRLAIKVRRADVLGQIDSALPKGFPAESALTFTTSIGLALRAAFEHEKYRSALH